LPRGILSKLNLNFKIRAESLSKLNFGAIQGKFEQAKILARWNLSEKLGIAIWQTQKCEAKIYRMSKFKPPFG